MEHVLELEGVTKRFGPVTAVDRLSFQVPRGSVYGFLGPNGSGKTTTLRMVMSIFYPDEGRLRVLGRERALDVKDRIGYLPEERGLYKKMKTADLLAYFGRLKGMEGRLARSRARELLTKFGLQEWADKPCEALSKGMGQKVQLLAVLIHEPELMILDEPFSGLDPVNMESMRGAILQMKREGRTVLFSTHVMAQAEEICDYILLIDKGRKLLNGTLSEVKSSGPKGIRLDYDGDGSILRELPGVTRINDAGKSAEIFLEEEADPQEILARLVGRIVIRRFDLREPSLHEIFIRAVGAGEGRAAG